MLAALMSLIPPLSLALSHKGRGEVLFEYIERFLLGLESSRVFAPTLDLCVPSPLAGEG